MKKCAKNQKKHLPTKKNLYIKLSRDGQIAQLVEQRTENPRVGGSIPSLATIKTKGRLYGVLFFVPYLREGISPQGVRLLRKCALFLRALTSLRTSQL